jgi:tRNA threonylcarbamoyladenosine biosynthesis protein TsaE
MITLHLAEQADTERLGAALAGLLRAGDAVLLEGPLGAGKSCLARALLRAASGDASLEVPSPSFTLVQSYRTPGLVVHHLDLWRLPAPPDVEPRALEELGWFELLQDAVLVEWPDRLGALAPAEALRVRLAYAGDGAARDAVLSGWGERLRALEPVFASIGWAG